MAKQLNVNLAFTADTSKASKDIQSLQQQLTQLMNSAIGDSKSLGLTKDIKEATTAVAQLKAQLSGAMSSTGTLDLTKFNDSLQKSGMTLEDYRRKLSALGPEGTQAFSQLASSIASAEIPLKQANNLVKEFSTTLMNTARWQLSSSLLHGFIGGLQQAYGYAKDLNSSLNNIRIVTGQSTDQMAQLAEKANKAARELSTRTTDYTKASLIYYQQGLDDKAVEERTRTTLKLSNVTRQSAEEVSNQMTAIWNNFDDGTKKLEYYADAITALGAKTASSSSEIAEGLSKFAAVADTIGLSYETAAASIATVVAETRQSADTVGNAFKAIFSRIQSLKLGETLEDGVGLTKYTQALETVGVKVLDINGNLREADDILSDLGNRWQEISDTQKNAVAQTVAGQRQYAQFIALFDNWDKVQQNTQLAADSEGTLQEQADIYAESWEASATRVRAALESIYQSLIDDDFFISFNNFLVGLIDRVNGLIKGLGGIPGVLTTIGGLLSRTFSSQVASNIDRIIDNITKKSIKGAQQQQRDAISALQKEADLKVGSGSKQGQAQSEGLKTQASLQQTLLNNQARYNEEELKTAQNILDQNANLREQARLAGEISDKKKQSAISEQNRFMRDFGSSGTNVEKYVQDLKNCNEQQALVQSSATTLSGILSSNFEDPAKKAELFTNEINEIKDGINLLGDVGNDDLTKLVEEFNCLFEAFEKGDKSEATMKNLISVLQQIGAMASDTGNQIENELVSEIDALGEDRANVSARVAKLSNSFKEAGEAAATSGEKMKAMKNGADAGAEAMDKMGQKSLSTGQMISGFSSDIFALASVINTVKGAIDTLNNEDLTFGEQMMAIIPSLLITLASLTNTLTGVGGAALVAAAGHLPLIGTYIAEEAAALGATETTLSLGAAIQVALPLLAAVGIAIAAVVATVGFVIKAIDDAIETPKEKAERLQKEVDNTSKAFDNAKTAVDNLKSAFDEYDTIKSTLDECKTGTTEWYDALNDVNNKVLEILQQYPELAKYLTRDENGVLGFSQEGKDFVENQQKENLRVANATQMQANISQKQNNVDIERSNLIDEYTSLLTGVFSQNIQYSEEIGKNLEEVVTNIADGKIQLEDVIGNLNTEDLVRKVASDQTPWNYTTKNESGEYETDYETVLDALRTYATDITEDMSQEEIEGMITGDFEAIHLAQSNYQESLSTLADMNEAYGKTIAEDKVKEELKNNPYLDQISAMSGKLYNSLYNQNATDRESESYGRLAEQFYDYVKANNVKGYDQLNKAGSYKDTEGKDATVSKETMIAALSAADALDSIVDSATEVGKTFEKLDKSGNDADKALMDIISTGEINQKGNALKQDFNKQSVQINSAMGGIGEKQLSEEEIAKIYLTSKLGDLETLAAAQGLDSSEEIIKAFLEGMSNYDKTVEEARDTGSHFLNEVYKGIIQANKDQVDNLSVENQAKIGDLLKSAVTGGGLEGLGVIQEVLSNTTDLESTIEGLSGDDINWATISIGELKDKLNEFGVNVKEIDNDKLQTLIDAMQQIGEVDFDSATEKYKKIHDIVDGLKTGDTISGEDFKEVLEPLDPEKMNQYFTAMADGTYKLTEDAEEFYNFINTQSLEDFKKGMEEAKQKLINISDLEQYRKYENGKNITDEGVTRDSKGNINGYKQAQIDAQIKYLSLLDLEEEQQTKLAIIKADSENNEIDHTMQVQNLKDLIELMEIYGENWEKVDEAQQKAENDVEKYRLAIESTAPNLKTLYKLFENGEFGKDTNWGEIAKEWKDLFFDESNITTLQDFKDALEEIGPTAEEGISTLDPKEARAKWDELKNSISLTVDDLQEFSSFKDTLSPEQMVEGYKEIANSAKNIEELDEVILQANEYGIDFTDIIINLLNQSDMTTAETIETIIDELIKGNGEAEKFLKYIEELYSKNDSEQTFTEQLEEMTEGFDKVRTEIQNKRNSINELLSKPLSPEYGSKLQAELKQLDADEQMVNKREGLYKMQNAVESDQMYDDAKVNQFMEGSKEFFESLQNGAIATNKEMETIGKQAIEIADSMQGWDFQEKADFIKDSFGGQELIEATGNIKLYSDTITDLILKQDDFDYSDIMEKAAAQGVDLYSVLERVDEVVEKIANDPSTNVTEKIHQLEHLYALSKDTGMVDTSSIAQGMADAVMNNNTMDIEQQQNYFNEMRENATEEGESLHELQFSAGVDVTDQIASVQEYISLVDEANGMFLESLSGDNFQSIEQLDSYVDGLSEDLQNMFNYPEKLAEYASQFDRCKDAVKEYNDAVAIGKDTSEALFKMDYLSRVEDAAKLYDIDGDRVQSLAEDYLELERNLNEEDKSLLGAIQDTEEFGNANERLAEAITDAATRDVRFNDAIEELRGSGSKLNSTMKSLVATAEKYKKSSQSIAEAIEDTAKGSQDYSKAMTQSKKIMSDLLGVESKMLKDDFVAKHFDKAQKAAEKGGDAIEEATKEMQQEFTKSLAEDIEVDNLSDKVVEALDGQDIDSAMNDFLSRMSELEDGATIDIDNEPFLQALIESQLAAGATAPEIESMLSGMGIDADVEPFVGSMAELEAAAAEAAASTAESGDAIVGNMGINAEANSQTFEAVDVKDEVGFDTEATGPTYVPVHVPDFVAGGNLPYGPGGTQSVSTVRANGMVGGVGTVYGFRAVPNKEEETEEKETTVTGVKVSNAHKSAGGKTGGSNKGGGGGGGRGGGCFVAGTLISTPVGFKNIEEIKVGDIVLSYNEKLQKNENSIVLQTIIHLVNDKIYTLYIENEQLIVTGIHRFFIIRKNQTYWIPASELQINDLVLFADGTLHKINKIKINNYNFIPVYNFEVSNNHNYYVGKNQILVHNKGRGGGGGRADRPTSKVNTSTKTSEHTHTDTRYHNLDKNLSKLTSQYNDIDKAKNRAFGNVHLKMLDTEIKKQSEIIDKQKEYKRAIEANLELDKKLINQQNKAVGSKTYQKGYASYENKNVKFKTSKKDGKTEYQANVTGTTRYASSNLKDLIGFDAEYDENGNITNYEKISAALDKVYNENQDKKTQIKDDSYFTNLGKKKGKKGKNAFKKNLNLQNETALVDAQVEQARANIEQYEDTVQKRMDKISEILDAHIEEWNLKLESINYELEFKMDIKESQLQQITNIIDNLGDSSRNAARSIEKLGESFVKTQEKIELYKNNFSKILGSHNASKRGLEAVETNQYDENGNVLKQYFSKSELNSNITQQQVNEAEAKIKNAKQEQENAKGALQDAKQKVANRKDKVLNNNEKTINKKSKEKGQKAADKYKDTNEYKKEQAKIDKMTDKKKKKAAQKKLDAKVKKIQEKAEKEERQKQETKALKNDTTYQELLKQQTAAQNNYNNKTQTTNSLQSTLDKAALNGQAIWEDFAKKGASSEYINKLKDRTDFSKDEIEQMSQDIADYSDAVQSLTQQRLEIFDKISNCLDQWTEKFDRIIQRQEHLNNLAEGYRNIVDLIGASNFYNSSSIKTLEDGTKVIDNTAQQEGYKLQDRMLKAQRRASTASMKNYKTERENIEHLLNGNTRIDENGNEVKVTGLYQNLQNAQKKLEEAKAQNDQKAIDIWNDDIDKYQEQINKLLDKSQELLENQQSQFQKTIEISEQEFENAIEKAVNAFSASIAGNAGSMDLLASAMERYDKLNNTFVKDYERVHQLRQLELEAQKSIDEANDPKIKRELLEIQDEITQNQKTGKQMSEYELTYLKQKLELKQAEAALEDAQNAKNQVSLTRDSEGNYGYVYTADANDVAEAEKNYNDKIYEMQKANQEYIDLMTNELFNLEQEFMTKMQEIKDNKDLTDEQKKLEMEKIKLQYETAMEDTKGQLELAFNASKDIYGKYSDIYAAITGDITAQDLNHIESFEQTVLAQETGVNDLETLWTNWTNANQTLLDDMNTAMIDHGVIQKEVWENAGYDVENFGETLAEEMEHNVEEVESLNETLTEMSKTAEDEFGATLDAAESFEDTWNSILGSMQEEVENLTEAINALKEAFEELSEVNDDITPATTTVADTTGGRNSKKGYKTVGHGRNTTRRGITTNRQINRLRTKQLKGQTAYRNAIKKAKKDGTVTKAEKRKAVRAAKRALKRELRKAQKSGYKGIKLKFNTGGYTGTWAGSEGRMAMLHQKELVLNQSDTENILSAVGMIRDIASRIDMNALAASGAFASGVSGIGNVGAGTFEQNVHITAEFPNATDRNEIFEAFKNITNLASQYANR